MLTVPSWLLNVVDFIRRPTGLLLTIGLLLACVFAGAYLKGRGDQREADLQAARTAQAKAQVADAHADAKADVQRVKDDAKVSQLQQDLSHADDAVSDSRPSAARRAYYCQQLRAQDPGAAVSAGC